MNSKENNEPPRWAISFFHWFCHPGFREEIEGDLRERFHERSGGYGAQRNKLLFIKDVISLFRPQLVGNFHQLTFNGFSKRGIVGRISEYYLILLVFLVGYKPPFSISTFNICIIAALILLSVFRNKIIWTVIAGLFILINLYMVFALLSEFSEFPTFVKGAQQLIFVGSAIIFLNITMCGALIAKYTQETRQVIGRALYFSTSILYVMALLGMSRRFPAHTTSHILFYTGLVLLVFTVIMGMIVIYMSNKKSMKENNPNTVVSGPGSCPTNH